jgi:hypothetical protein
MLLLLLLRSALQEGVSTLAGLQAWNMTHKQETPSAHSQHRPTMRKHSCSLLFQSFSMRATHTPQLLC